MRSPKPASPDRGRRVTIREVAALADVSLGTASRVINKVANVSPEIREKVEVAIRTLGYTPDVVAQSMRNGESKTVGILVRNITSPVLAGFVRSAQEVLNAEDYTVLLACFEESREREISFLRTAASRRIDGLIMTTTSEIDADLLATRAAVDIPTVLFDREVPETDDALLIAHEQGVMQALAHLFALGHRHIAFLTGSESVYPARARLRGYRRFFEEKGLPVDGRLVKSSSFAEEGTFIETSTLLGLAQPPTAIVLGGISMLAGAMRAIAARGLRVPQDVSLVGSGDSELALLASPPISVVRWNLASIGSACALLLLDRLKGRAPQEPRRIVVPTEFVIRGSCAAR
ncbi:MAG: transcriptional regulatory protein [Pseudomonadota bacterium]